MRVTTVANDFHLSCGEDSFQGGKTAAIQVKGDVAL